MTDTTIADTTQEVTDATQEAVKQVNQLTQYVQAVSYTHLTLPTT